MGVLLAPAATTSSDPAVAARITQLGSWTSSGGSVVVVVVGVVVVVVVVVVVGVVVVGVVVAGTVVVVTGVVVSAGAAVAPSAMVSSTGSAASVVDVHAPTASPPARSQRVNGARRVGSRLEYDTTS